MTHDSNSDSTGTDEAPTATRRAWLTTSAALLGGGLLAGCVAGDESTDAPADTDEPTPTPTDAGDEATETPESADAAADTPYSVSIEPMGSVEFEQVPETWVANNGSWADMGVALGLEPPKAVWLTGRYHTQYYDGIPGVSVDKSDMVSLYQGGVDKELFHELDADVHVLDPNFLMNRFKGWERSDVDEIRDRVGPFFGNSIFSTGYEWHEDYQYYTLYEAFEKLAAAFRERERYEAFAGLHEEFQSELSDVVPDDDAEKPAVAIMWANGDEPDEFSPYLIGEGTSFKQWRDLEVRDALAETDVHDFHSERVSVDYETLIEIDPDVILLRGQEAKTRSEFEDTVVSYFEGHDVASALSAVRSGDVYRGGSLYQGPITNLVLTERAASQVYGVDRELFDRERVADIVAGDF